MNINNTTGTSSDSDVEYVYAVGSVNTIDQPRTTIKLNGNLTDFLVDSGSSVNLLDMKTFNRIGNNLRIKPCHVKIYPYGSREPLPIVGKVMIEAASQKEMSYETFYVVDGDHGCLLGYTTSRALGLLQMVNMNVSSGDHPIASQYPELFEGIGCYQSLKVKLHIEFRANTSQENLTRVSGALNLTRFRVLA